MRFKRKSVIPDVLDGKDMVVMKPENAKRNDDSYAFNPAILRAYDIRGRMNETLSARDAYYLGRAFATYVTRETGGKHICVGYDGRLSSPALADSLIQGLTEAGAQVENIGLGPSPMLYFAVKHSGADGGVMVTGSHNPPDYNGFKMMLQTRGVFGAAVQELGRIAANGDFEAEAAQKTPRNVDIKNIYVDRLLQDLSNGRPLKVAWDAGNGAAGEVLRLLTAKLPGEHILLYDEIDGRFPNHHPDPTVDENLTDLRETVLAEGCDLGIALDGDGDRIGVIDEKGGVLRCDVLMTLYAREVLQNHPGATIIGDVKCSQVMFEEIKRMGGTPLMWKTGHSLVKSKMAEMNAPLAGELSGHIFFADRYYGYDDALYCAIRLLNIIAKSGGGLSAHTAGLPKLYSTPEVRFEVRETEKFDLVDRAAKLLDAQNNQSLDVNDIDGVRVNTENGWWLLRASNTQNVLVFRAESQTAKGLERLIKAAGSVIEKLGYELNIPDIKT